MGLIELFLLAVGLSMDAFAVSVSTGLTMDKATLKKSLIVGLYFGAFQAVMPVIGYLLAVGFAEYVIALAPWIAFALLAFLGVRMMVGGLKKEVRASGFEKQGECAEIRLGPKKMLPLAVATSIDALAVGVSMAFLGVNIVYAVLLIGAVTFAVSMAGVKIGSVFGAKFKSKAEILGGVILIGIGLNILLGS